MNLNKGIRKLSCPLPADWTIQRGLLSLLVQLAVFWFPCSLQCGSLRSVLVELAVFWFPCSLQCGSLRSVLVQLAVFWFPCSLDDTVWLVAFCIGTVGCVLVTLQPGLTVQRAVCIVNIWRCSGFPAYWTTQHGSLRPVLFQLAMFGLPADGTLTWGMFLTHEGRYLHRVR
jgi:hypothetical protein